MNPVAISRAEAARAIFREALAGIDPRRYLRERVRVDGGVLSVEAETALRFDLHAFDRVLLLAVGKAATPMAEVLGACLAGGLRADQQLAGLVIGTSLPVSPDPRLQFRLGSHPMADEKTLSAARAALRLMETADDRTLIFVLISGGASAMMDLPLDPSIPAEDLFAFHRALVRSGLSITEMNALRKHFSAVKGGRLAERAAGATICTLLISDVPSGQLDVVGSGPSLPDASTVADCRRLIGTYRETLALPPRVQAFFDSPDLPETPKAGDAAFARAQVATLLSSRELCATAAAAAARLGWRPVIDLTCDEWAYDKAAAYLLTRLEGLRGDGPVCLISGGEISVRVPAVHGAGGRNQHFALECARRLAASGVHATVLSAGSDGIDGHSPAAGAVADETTFARAAAGGLDAETALTRFDSYGLFHSLGDAVVTGPSGNNVRDLRLLLAE